MSGGQGADLRQRALEVLVDIAEGHVTGRNLMARVAAAKAVVEAEAPSVTLRAGGWMTATVPLLASGNAHESKSGLEDVGARKLVPAVSDSGRTVSVDVGEHEEEENPWR